MDALQKTSILSNLYGIRAGMSVASLERQKLAHYETQQDALAEEEKKRIGEWEVAVGHGSAAYRGKQEEIKREERAIAVAERQMEQSLAARILAVLGVFLVFGALIWSIIYLLQYVPIIMSEGNDAIIAFWGVSVDEVEITSKEFMTPFITKFLIPLAVFSISLIISIILFRKLPSIFGKLGERLSAPARKAESEKRIAGYRKEMAKLDEELTARKNEITQYYRAKRAAIFEEYHERLAPIARFVTALEQTYGSFLDPRDWRYVDLIIFYFETGRADSMKEALQQVDHQVQTEMIVQAISRAVTELRGIIFYAAERVGQAVREGWQKVSAQMATMQTQLAAQNAKLNDIVSEQKLANALRECAEKDSMRLMEDVNYICTHMKQ